MSVHPLTGLNAIASFAMSSFSVDMKRVLKKYQHLITYHIFGKISSALAFFSVYVKPTTLFIHLIQF